MSDAGFGQALRWANVDAAAIDHDFVLRRELSDRELESYLDSPPQKSTGMSVLAWDASQDMTARVANLTARWERQKGRFVTLQITGNGTGVAFTPPTLSTPWELGITLPASLVPREDITNYSAAMVEWYISIGLPERSVGVITKRPSDGKWIVACLQQFRNTWGANVTDGFAVHATFPAAR